MNKYRVTITHETGYINGYLEFTDTSLPPVDVDIIAPTAADAWLIAEKNARAGRFRKYGVKFCAKPLAIECLECEVPA